MIGKIISICLFFAAVAFAQAIGPVATVPQIDYKYVNVQPGASLSHTYMIYNGGDETLYLSDVKTTCRCITASLDKNKLVPTDSARLEVTYSPTGNSNALDNYVSVKTNDPSNPDIRIYVTRASLVSPTLATMPKDTIAGSAGGPLAYFPVTSHNFGKIKTGAIVDHVFKFYNRGNSNLIIKNIATSCGCTAAVVKNKTIAPGKEGELRVQFDSTGKYGRLSRRVTMYTNDSHEPMKTIVIFADVMKAGK